MRTRATVNQTISLYASFLVSGLIGWDRLECLVMPKPPKHTGTSDNTEPGASTGAAGTDTASTQTKDPELVAFGLQVRARRDEIGISQEDLAGRTGLHVTYISRIERGIQDRKSVV